ncbi:MULTISPECIES: class F sortase [unclassified Streptomyces]|uniref:class F sortase n=1 Tax=unclassified Streptomyces TaxID=2593676 RepID=UPI002ED6909F|nr:class F sortase [Streptomyces sp. NBC_00891]WSY09978.1 class F sortase [Streptomyces sp. NBC_00890]WSZ11600.1 class F sortase [Streptomyces sp. NBC_00869]WSZ27417.1 class F sortase [Streptomyces sp. NBC_00870]
MPRTPVAAALTLTALAALTACSGVDPAPSSSASNPPPSSTAAADPAPTATAEPPAHVSIPSLGVSSDVMRLGLNPDRTVEVPPADKGMTTGWYTGSAVPGEPGAAVLIGHNDTRYGRAVFHDLRKITKGADIAIRDAAGSTTHFEVTARETVSKNAFPTARVYGRTTDRALRLITCDGAFDANGHPVDNLIVYAKRK